MKYKVSVWRNGEPLAAYRDNDIQSLVKICKDDFEYEFTSGRFEFYVYENDIEISDEEFRCALGLDN